MGAFIDTYFWRITSLLGTHNLAVYPILSWFLRAVRLVLHPKLYVYTSPQNETLKSV